MAVQHFHSEIFGYSDDTYFNIIRDVVKRFPSGSHFVEVGALLGKSSSYMAVEIANSGKNIFKTLVSVGNKLKAWVGKAIQIVIKTAGETAKRTPQAIRTVRDVMQRVKPMQRIKDTFKTVNELRKTPIKETIKSIQSSGIGQKIGGTINKISNFKLTEWSW